MQALFENYNTLFEGSSGNWDVDLRNFLEYYLQELHNQTNSSPLINFSQAAIVLQKSAIVYERKVDYLWQLVTQLLDVLQLSKTVAETESRNDDDQPNPPDEAVPSTSKKVMRKARTNKSHLFEAFSPVQNKISAKSLDLPGVNLNSSKAQQCLTRSAVFGRMVTIKKRRKHELYVFDNNEECMGKKDDFRLSWSLNHHCALIEDPSDESIMCPPPVSERVNVAMACEPSDFRPLSPNSEPGCVEDCGFPEAEPGSSEHSPNQEVPGGIEKNQIPNINENQEVPEGGASNQEDLPMQEVPSEPGPSQIQGFALPDTPPDSEVMRDAPGVNEEQLISPIGENVEGAPVIRRSTRERNSLKEGDKLSPLNYLFSKSLLDSLEQSSLRSEQSYSEKLSQQAARNRSKAKRRFQEVMDNDGDVVAFEECDEPSATPSDSEMQFNSDLVPLEVPQIQIPVPTPPPTPANSQTMSPPPMVITPRSDMMPATPGPSGGSPNYLEEPLNMLNPFQPDAREQDDRSARVAAWHKSIKQRLEEANSRPHFDVHLYGSKVINAFPSVKSTLEFKDLVDGMDSAEIARVFLTSLMLANTENVKISLADSNHLAVDCMSLTLISTQRHEEELEAFCAPSVDLQKRNNLEVPQPGPSGLFQRKRKQRNDSSRSVPLKQRRT